MRLLILLFIVVILFLYITCNSGLRLKKEIFEKVQVGMTIQEVKKILGEPEEIRHHFDSTASLFYPTRNNLLITHYATVSIDKKGFVVLAVYHID